MSGGRRCVDCGSRTTAYPRCRGCSAKFRAAAKAGTLSVCRCGAKGWPGEKCRYCPSTLPELRTKNQVLQALNDLADADSDEEKDAIIDEFARGD